MLSPFATISFCSAQLKYSLQSISSSFISYRSIIACGLTNDEASRVVRVSFGDETTEHDVDEFVNVVVEYKEKFVR